jgi:hypothetical protein
MPNAGDNWTREEHLLAFNLYCKIPFATIGMRNPKVIELAHPVGTERGFGFLQAHELCAA